MAARAPRGPGLVRLRVADRPEIAAAGPARGRAAARERRPAAAGAPREDTGCRRLEGTAKSGCGAAPTALRRGGTARVGQRARTEESSGERERERNGHRPGAGSPPRGPAHSPGESAAAWQVGAEYPPHPRAGRPPVPRVEREGPLGLPPAGTPQREDSIESKRCRRGEREREKAGRERGRQAGRGERESERGVAGQPPGEGESSTRVPPAREREKKKTRGAATSRREGRRGGPPRSGKARTPSETLDLRSGERTRWI